MALSFSIPSHFHKFQFPIPIPRPAKQLFPFPLVYHIDIPIPDYLALTTMAIVTLLSFISHSSIVLATQIHDTIFNTNYTIHYCVTYRRQKLITFCVKATNKAHKV